MTDTLDNARTLDATDVARRYIAAWNETDAQRRERLVDAGWSEAATYVDPLASACGRGEIAALIGAVQQQYPGFRFALDGRVDGHGDKLRFSWTFGPEGEPDLIRGTDFAVVEDGRLASVTGFLDKVPG